MTTPRRPTVSSESRHRAQRHLALVSVSQFAPEGTCAVSFGPAGATLRSNDVDTFEMLGRWRAWLSGQYAPKTVTGYWGAATRFFAYAARPLRDITEDDVAAWLETFGYRSHARRTYHQALHSLFAYALRHGEIAADPTKGIRVAPPLEKVPRAMTDDQLRAVTASAFSRHPTHGYTCEVLYYSGARISEVLALTWEDVMPDSLVLRKTKNGKEREVPLSEGLRHGIEGLRDWFGERERVLPRSQQTVWLWVRRAGIAAGVPDVHPHLFRSTMATRAMSNGARANAVRLILGHAKLTTTSRYLAEERADLEAAVNLL